MSIQRYDDISQIGLVCGIIGTFTPQLKEPLISAIKNTHCNCFLIRAGQAEDTHLLKLMKKQIDENPLIRLGIFYNKQQLLSLPSSKRLLCDMVLESADYTFNFPWLPDELFLNIAVRSQMLIVINSKQHSKTIKTIKQLNLYKKIVYV